MNSLRLSVIGTGYLGATHAACLAELGFEVLAVDSDRAKIEALSQGRLPFCEPDLEELLVKHLASGRLRFTTSLCEAALFAEAHFVCVGTPQLAGSLGADLSAVTAVVEGLAKHTPGETFVIGKSTVPVGTAAVLQELVDTIAPARVRIAWNPEFLREGHAVADTLHPDRLVFGVADPKSEQVLRAIHARILQAGTPLHVTDLATAELAKTAANAFLATKISFINAMAELSERSGADVVALADILGDDPRIGRRFLNAGLGFGGGCLPKDIRALSARANELGAPAVSRLMHEVDSLNLQARRRAVDLVLDLVGPELAGRRIAVLGAAFKPHSDDVRDSPALAVAGHLHRRGAEVRVFDPEARVASERVCPGPAYVEVVEDALRGADLVLLLTEWPELTRLDPAYVAGLTRRRLLVDARNALEHDRWRAAGWTVRALGRGRDGAGSPAGTAPLARPLGEVATARRPSRRRKRLITT